MSLEPPENEVVRFSASGKTREFHGTGRPTDDSASK
jgi:hypothetical protein